MIEQFLMRSASVLRLSGISAFRERRFCRKGVLLSIFLSSSAAAQVADSGASVFESGRFTIDTSQNYATNYTCRKNF